MRKEDWNEDMTLKRAPGMDDVIESGFAGK
jgi:hypothetical protein